MAGRRIRRAACQAFNYCPPPGPGPPIDGLSERYRRSSLGLKEWLRAVAVELGGRAGERLCRKLHLAAGRSRLLELLEAPPVPGRAPRVLGVDEFAFRRGRRYGTLLVDIETGSPVDVLPDRSSDTFTAWLTDYPGVEIVCRDRATTYIRAVKEAAPHALEIADRWHLLQNLSSAVEKTCHQHCGCLRKRLEEEQLPAVEVPEVPVVLLPPPELPRSSMVERTRHRYADVHRLLERGWTISAIGRHLDLDRKTVRKFKNTDLDVLLSSAQDRRPNGVLEPFKPYLNARFTNGITSGAQLFQEIRDRGYRGSVQVVRKHLAALRTGTTEPVRVAAPSPRKITSWIMRPREKLSESEIEQLDQVRLACPDIARACDLARVFQDLVRNRRGHLLLEWIRQAEGDDHGPMRSFAGFLRQDLDAVTAGLTHAWSSGMVEGHVNRVKTLKRAIYGRASFRLLRIRILTRP